MISVVTTNDTLVANPYAGMNLAETCSALMLESNEIINNLQMDILLNEHQYLYENATEITYVNEDGSDNENAVKLKDKILNALSEFGKKIAAAFDNAISWVKDFIDKFVTELKKRSITKAHFDKAVKAFDAVFADKGIAAKSVAPYTVDYDDFKAQWGMYFRFGDADLKRDANTAVNDNAKAKAANSAFASVDTSGTDLYAIFVHDNENSNKMIKKDDLEEAGKFVFAKSIVKDITDTKHSADKKIREQMRDVKTAKGDDMTEHLSKLSAQIKENSKVASSAIKVYHAQLKLQINIIKAVFSRPEIKKYISDANKAEFKANMEKAKNAPKNFASSIKEKNEAKKAERDAKKAEKTANKDQTAQNASAILYDEDGKFFRV